MRLLLLAAFLLASLHVWANTYRWVDERGRVHYSDTLPPQAVEPAVLDKQGRVLRRNSRAAGAPDKTQAEREAGQERQDRALLSTYVHEGEIDLARERALAQERARLESLQAMLEQVRGRLARIEAEAAGHEKAGRRPPPALLQARGEARDEIARLNALIARSNAAAAQIEARYDAYKRRFRQLKGLLDEPRLSSKTDPPPATAAP